MRLILIVVGIVVGAAGLWLWDIPTNLHWGRYLGGAVLLVLGFICWDQSDKWGAE